MAVLQKLCSHLVSYVPEVMENNMTRLVCLFIDFIISPASMKQNVMVLKYNYVDDFLTSSIK